MIKEYNNQRVLIIDNMVPINDNDAVERGNSLRLLFDTTNTDKWYECKNICINNPDCAFYDFKQIDNKTTSCKIFRREPYKKIEDLSFNDCMKFCSHDDDCDYLSHSINNKCELFSREKGNGKTAVGDLWFDFPIYGINTDKGNKVRTFNDCIKKNKTAVYYKDKYNNDGLCVPKKFFKYNPGNRTVYFNKDPVNKYKSLNPIIGLKSKHRENIEKYKFLILIIFLVFLFMMIYYFSNIIPQI